MLLEMLMYLETKRTSITRLKPDLRNYNLR